MSKENDFNNALYGLRRNYPQYTTTFGNCCTDGCANSARGSGKCAICCENQIAGIIGGDKGKRIASLIREGTELAAVAVEEALAEI